MKKIFIRFIFLLIFFFLLFVLILYTRGYRINISQKNLTSTGILVASSFPDGAKIYIDDELKGATNSNFSLPPKKYRIEIKKDGYSPWEKDLIIKGELVVKTDAMLFPQNPSLSPITSLGVVSAQFSEKDNEIIILSNSQNIKKDGVYLLETSKRSLSIFNPLRLLTLKSTFKEEFDFKNTAIEFSPDAKQIIFSIFELNKKTKKNIPLSAYLISTEGENKELFEITKSKETIEEAWAEEQKNNLNKILETLKSPLSKIASQSFEIISFSPDESKILYRAKENITVPTIIKPPLIASNQTKEERNLQKGNIYVYDKKEDKNFLITNYQPSTISHQPPANFILWYSDSTHLVLNEKEKIAVIGYDGQNKQVVYSGPHESDFLAVTADGKLLILANLNSHFNKLPDIYAIGIR